MKSFMLCKSESLICITLSAKGIPIKLVGSMDKEKTYFGQIRTSGDIFLLSLCLSIYLVC